MFLFLFCKSASNPIRLAQEYIFINDEVAAMDLCYFKKKPLKFGHKWNEAIIVK